MTAMLASCPALLSMHSNSAFTYWRNVQTNYAWIHAAQTVSINKEIYDNAINYPCLFQMQRYNQKENFYSSGMVDYASAARLSENSIYGAIDGGECPRVASTITRTLTLIFKNVRPASVTTSTSFADCSATYKMTGVEVVINALLGNTNPDGTIRPDYSRIDFTINFEK